MTRLKGNQRQLIDAYSIIPDPQERLSVVIGRSGSLPAVPPELCTPEAALKGCQSPVWITGRAVDGLLHWSLTSPAPLIRGLVLLLCEEFEGVTPDEAAEGEASVLAALGLTRQLSPTRLAGLAAIRQHLRTVALDIKLHSTPPL